MRGLDSSSLRWHFSLSSRRLRTARDGSVFQKETRCEPGYRWTANEILWPTWTRSTTRYTTAITSRKQTAGTGSRRRCPARGRNTGRGQLRAPPEARVCGAERDLFQGLAAHFKPAGGKPRQARARRRSPPRISRIPAPARAAAGRPCLRRQSTRSSRRGCA